MPTGPSCGPSHETKGPCETGRRGPASRAFRAGGPRPLRISPCVSVCSRATFPYVFVDVLGQRLRVDRLMTLRDPCGACPDTWRVRADTVRVRGAAPLESGTAAPPESGTYVEPPARPPRTRRAHASRVHLSPGGAEHARYGTGTRWVRGAKSGERRGGCCAAFGPAPGPRRVRAGPASGLRSGPHSRAPEQLRNSSGKASGRLREGSGSCGTGPWRELDGGRGRGRGGGRGGVCGPGVPGWGTRRGKRRGRGVCVSGR